MLAARGHREDLTKQRSTLRRLPKLQTTTKRGSARCAPTAQAAAAHAALVRSRRLLQTLRLPHIPSLYPCARSGTESAIPRDAAAAAARIRSAHSRQYLTMGPPHHHHHPAPSQPHNGRARTRTKPGLARHPARLRKPKGQPPVKPQPPGGCCIPGCCCCIPGCMAPGCCCIM